MRLRARWASTALLLLVPLLAGGTDALADPRRSPLPIERSASAIPGQYIVSLNPEQTPDGVLRTLGVKPMFTYDTALRGFAARLTPSQLAVARTIPAVKAVEENATVSVVLPPSPSVSSSARTGSEQRAVPSQSWGLDRIDQRLRPLDGEFSPVGTGSGVSAYIVDTGIDTSHGEFGGRASVGFDAVGDGRAGQDCNGHGTHVAGTVGGSTYGVARSVSLIAVRVLNCQGQGSVAGVLAGFDWVSRNARQPAVLNASLGGGASASIDAAVNAVADRGVLPVVAAGNEAQNACNVSPARATKAFTVGATDSEDREADFSNYGACLEAYAPGVDIVSAQYGGGTVAHDGTSMASPHVAGVAALVKERYPNAAPADVSLWLTDNSTKNVVTSISAGSPNRLLYTGGL
ncbi:S8 family peptidase [Streptomyces albipurpureus]|uniref:S8 family peptidase n=1 Tax=Streptomyces albipurpureus TaxID=2897419 RepID=A0ABT0UK74_9ACTN|nr:S8 family peptidase [Streptomyces sp. CWNU-1]MCM2387788.1 S8 family peptidase [Streptomyces sp. CWNU-1]